MYHPKVDCDFFKHIICTKFYRSHTINLCNTIADMTKRLSTEKVDPVALRHFTACRLISLKKEETNVRPIGIGEVLRRITGKCITTILRKDTQEASGILQTCCGLPGGIDAAIHATRQAFEDEETEAVLLVDAKKCIQLLESRHCNRKHEEIISPSLPIYI